MLKTGIIFCKKYVINFAKSIAFYLEGKLEISVGILDHVNFDTNKLKEEMQKPLYVEWNYKSQTITVTLNNEKA